jgi:1-acyl-sn-glycerol-3-phosphate acyltransferase
VVFYRTVRVAFRVIAAPLFRFRVSGAEHVPRRGPAILVAPHRSWLDPACIGGACPRPVRFLIMERVFTLRGAGWFFRAMHALPVDPAGESSLAAVRAALGALRAGELVGIFPEGRVVREDEPVAVRSGAALLARHAPAPVIPVWIGGSARAWPRGRRWPGPAPVEVRIGPPLEPPDRGGRTALAEMMERIDRALRALAAGG